MTRHLETTIETYPISGVFTISRGSRTSAVWSGVVGLGVLLVLLIVFIAQNTQEAEVNFLGWSGSAP